MTDNSDQHTWQAEEYHQHSSAQKEAADHLIESIQWQGTERVLDIGCGDGKISANIASRLPAGSVHGIDVSLDMIDFARQTFRENQHPNLTFRLQNAEALDYHEEFDVVFSSFAAQWIQDQNSFFSGIYRSLKPLGTFAATIPLGISSALEESIDTIMSLPEWSPYFTQLTQKFRFFSSNEFAEFLANHPLKPTRFAHISQEVFFPSREHFEKYVLTWFIYLQFLPDQLKLIFFQQIIDNYLKTEPLLSNGSVRFTFPRLDIIATKSIL